MVWEDPGWLSAPSAAYVVRAHMPPVVPREWKAMQYWHCPHSGQEGVVGGCPHSGVWPLAMPKLDSPNLNMVYNNGYF